MPQWLEEAESLLHRTEMGGPRQTGSATAQMNHPAPARRAEEAEEEEEDDEDDEEEEEEQEQGSKAEAAVAEQLRLLEQWCRRLVSNAAACAARRPAVAPYARLRPP